MAKKKQGGAKARQFNWPQKAFALIALAMAAGFVGVSWVRVYLVQEFFFFLGLSVFLAIFVANLLILAILVHKGAQFVLHTIRKARPGAAPPVEVPAEAHAGLSWNSR